jgi:predicted lipoprotein with Yx(FWY)xxD motif
MRACTRTILPTLAAALLLSACGSSSSSSTGGAASSSPPAAAPAGGASSGGLVKTASSSQLGGTVLANSQGLTLYRLSGEQKGKFICTSAACLAAWHPLVVPAGGQPSGSVGSLGQVKRPDGSEQVTYKGMPLYTFAADHSPGQAKGQGLKDVGTWNAVMTSAGTASAPPPATTTTSSTASGGGYAY